MENFIELAVEDPNEHMAGSALKELIESSKISDKQFEHLKLPWRACGAIRHKMTVVIHIHIHLQHTFPCPSSF